MPKGKKKSIYMHKQEEWANLYRQGWSFRKIAEREDVFYRTVQNVIKDVVEIRPKQKYTEEAKEWARLYEQGSSVNAIGEQFGVAVPVVSKYLKQMGIELRYQPTRERQYDHLIEEWVALYQEQKSLREIADQYGVHPQTVHNYIRDRTEMREYHETSRQHTANDHYFDSIDSNEKAYWLGFVFSSGCIIRGTGLYAIQLSVSEKDKDRLDRFKEVLESDNPYDIRNTTPKPYYQLRVHSKHLYQALQLLGLEGEKTESLTYPKALDSSFHSAFILGYYEGRGSCYYSVTKTENREYTHTFVRLFGTESMLKTIQSIIEQQVHITFRFRWGNTHFDRGDRIDYVDYCYLETGIQADLKRFANWLYQDKTEYSKKRDIRAFLNKSEKGENQ